MLSLTMLPLIPRGLLKSAPRTNPFQAKTSVGYASRKKQRDGISLIVQKDEAKKTCSKCKSYPITFNGYAATNRLVSAPLVLAFRKFHYSTASETKRTIPLPPLAESISSGIVFSVEKPKGSQVSTDDIVIVVETEKVQVEVRTPCAGVIESIFVSEGDTVEVGQDLFVVMEGASIPPPQDEKKPEKPPSSQTPSPQEQKSPNQEGAKQKPPVYPSSKEPSASESSTKSKSPPTYSQKPPDQSLDRTDTRVRMTQARKKTALRLKESQNMAAMLTTFNEVDMQELTNFRNLYKDRFQEKYGVKLGFMSAFTKASAMALTEIPILNATIDGDEIVYHNYVDISVAVSTPTSLVVPVIRNVQYMSFDQIELAINEFAKKARDNKLSIEDMSGGTFTISNGGVFGSLMGTPIINPPQSAILGMHAINKRPTVLNDQILIRPMMYLALTYDHRLIDGRDAVTFLKRIKTLIEDPTSILLNV